jgi:hypothetical protein
MTGRTATTAPTERRATTSAVRRARRRPQPHPPAIVGANQPIP